MNRKGSSVASLGAPSENRRMSMAKGFGGSNEALRRASNAPKQSVSSGPSLVGLLASKRLAKRLTSRFFDKRGKYGSRLSSQTQMQVPKEPSYRMEPHKKFSPEKVHGVIEEVLNEKLGRFKYNPKFCANISKVLSDEIKDKVKLLGYDRYRIICQVHIGEKKDQSIVTCSRCVWDDNLDNYATYTFQNNFIFSTATVFGVYSE
ncbi:dynein light chain Tctex-type protein 2B-like [Haliotis rubra]|uniref:dynein light chain Tctex-type protein 2B-like n=1 Tax=Haliotis rubra TaxID=36100 RepID=UPI001EE5B8A1|nr:dynein light chain Tctex-type protein 2B-like [Haliotis rubra]